MADISKIKTIDGTTYDIKDSFIRDIVGLTEAPYIEVEWVESNGKQYAYLDWKPPIATWGFEADFLVKNAFNTTNSAWDASTNVNGWGCIFGTYNSTNVNDISLSTYSTTGTFHAGGGATSAVGFKTDKTRQTMKYTGTTFIKPNGTSMTIARASETSNKPYCNMVVFGKHNGLRKAGSGSIDYPSTTRIYSLKFYENTTVKVDLVGAIRKRDGVTGLYDKISKHFYPAPGMTYGDVVGDIGDIDTVLEYTQKTAVDIIVNNPSNTRLLQATVPQLSRLEDGQRINVTFMYAIAASTQTTALAGWDDTGSNSYVYLKLTLADDVVTDWIPCYFNGTTRLTTHYYAGHAMSMTYRENVFIGASATAAGSTIMRAFFCEPDYNTNSDTTYTLYYMNPTVGTGGLKKYSLFMMLPDGTYASFTTTDGTGTSKPKNTVGFVPGKIYYHWHSSSHKAGSSEGSNNCVAESFGAIDLQYSGNQGKTLTSKMPVYLVGTIGTDGLFYLDDSWFTQTTPTTEDGKVYFYLGCAYGTYQIHLEAHNPMFKYVNGAFREISVDSITTNGHTVAIDVPSNAVFTDTTYESKAAASGGTAVSLVTTGEKYTWNNKSTVPTNHASTATTYGTGSSSNYGHVKLSSSTSSTSAENGGIAATPSAVKTAYDLANSANTTANTALSGVNGNLIYDHTFTISNGVATFTPHVYQKGEEVTTNYAKSCFTWKYRLIDGSEVTLTTKNDRGCDVTITNLGYGGHVIGIFTPA